MARVFPRVASSRARTPRDGARARRARLTTTRATTENGGDGDAGAKKVGRFVRNDGATPRAPPHRHPTCPRAFTTRWIRFHDPTRRGVRAPHPFV